MGRNKQYLKEKLSTSLKDSNYLLNISKKNKYIYFEVPKAASSTIKYRLQLLEVDNDKSLIPKHVHDKLKSPLNSPLVYNIDDLENMFQSYYKFSIVRNPFTRILSCYLEKICGVQWERDIRLPQLGFDPNDNISFIDFLKAIQKQNPFAMDLHWMPQTHLLSINKLSLDFVGKQESFESDFNKIIIKIFDFQSKNMVNKATHSSGADEKLNKYFSKEAIDLVVEIYSDDFKNFNYATVL